MKRASGIFLSLAAALMMVAPAQAEIQRLKISPKVLSILQAAKADAFAGNFGIALAKVKKAEAVKSTPEDAIIIKQMRDAFEVKIADIQGRPYSRSQP